MLNMLEPTPNYQPHENTTCKGPKLKNKGTTSARSSLKFFPRRYLTHTMQCKDPEECLATLS